MFISKVEFAEVELLHVGKCRIASVVHHHIPNNANAFAVRGIDEGFQFVFGAHVVIELGPVLVVVAMVAIMFEVTAIATANPAVDLL